MTMNTKLSRRTLLRGLGTVMALPWLEAMAPAAPLISGIARTPAAADDAPVRMAFLYVPNGMHMPDWTPQVDRAAKYFPQDAEPGKAKFKLGSIMTPVEAHQSKTNVFTNLCLVGAEAQGDGGGDHARSVAAFLTGAHPKKTHGKDIRNGVSIDQLAAEKIGHLTRLKSLELGTESSSKGGQCDSGYSCLYTSNISWRNETSPLPKETQPSAVFSRLFGSADEMENGRALDAREKRRQSILDHVQGEAKILSHRLSAHDRRKLDEYLYAVRDIERRLKSTDRLDLEESDVSNFPRPAGTPQEYGEHVKLLFDMMVLAFQTDSTRVASFMFANAGSNRSYKNLTVSEGHHDLSHHGKNAEKQQKISKINQYHMSLTDHLLTKLDSIQEGERTLLDNCMIVHGSGIADGNSHHHRDLPIAMFGRGGGKIETGRVIECRTNTPLTNLYRSMLENVGAEVDEFSDSTGPLSELPS